MISAREKGFGRIKEERIGEEGKRGRKQRENRGKRRRKGRVSKKRERSANT